MHAFLKSFTYAWQGIVEGYRGQRNIKVQSAIGLTALCLGAFLQVGAFKIILILWVSACVLAAELLNTALEKYLDAFHPEKHSAVGKVKDLAAGAVLVLSMGAAGVGLWIFLPAILK